IPHGKVQFVITVGEESGLYGARALDTKHLDAKFGYAVDSNGNVGDIAVAAPTQAIIEIEFIGKSAHAGVNPEDGISAIQVASKAVSLMSLGRIDHETTANIGSFRGGKATNIVCDYVILEAEARSIVDEKMHKQVEKMKQACADAASHYGAQYKFDSEVIYPGYSYDEQSPVVQLATKALAKLGKKGKTFHSGGGSDANIFNGMGIPTVNLAVGYQEIHTTNEYIAVNDLTATSEFIVAIIEEAARS
ncbi:MAG: hypothetical protein A2189_00890, partial [Paenibacillus sp. RIFOXYA1_FULL_44_5]